MSPINRSAYERLKTGMTYEEVENELGSPGELLSSQTSQLEPGFTFGAMVTEVYEWDDGEGGALRVMFGRGKLREKTQYGLDEGDEA